MSRTQPATARLDKAGLGTVLAAVFGKAFGSSVGSVFRPSLLTFLLVVLSATLSAAALADSSTGTEATAAPASAASASVSTAPAQEADPASLARPGDVIFQSLRTPQTAALVRATGSEWTHCGLVFERRGRLVVMEALMTMTETPLELWIARGGGRYVLTRWTGAGDGLSPEALAALDRVFGELRGRRYDFGFRWSDDRLYCSELVHKLFERALGVVLTAPRRIGDYDLGGPEVRRIVRERFPDGLDLEEPAVSPADLLASPLLAEVAAETGGEDPDR